MQSKDQSAIIQSHQSHQSVRVRSVRSTIWMRLQSVSVGPECPSAVDCARRALVSRSPRLNHLKHKAIISTARATTNQHECLCVEQRYWARIRQGWVVVGVRGTSGALGLSLNRRRSLVLLAWTRGIRYSPSSLQTGQRSWTARGQLSTWQIYGQLDSCAYYAAISRSSLIN